MAKKNSDSIWGDLNASFLTPIEKASKEVNSKFEDPFKDMYGGGDPLEIMRPPYTPGTWVRVPEISDILGTLVESMAVNVDGFGWQLDPAPHLAEFKDEIPAAIKKEMDEEKAKLNLLFNFPNCNCDEDLVELRKRKTRDEEKTGTAYWEIVRNREGAIAEIYHLDSSYMRMTYQDADWTDFTERVRTETGDYEEINRRKKFRRFVQVVNGQKKIYFKEFGDPRTISYKTGKEISGKDNPASEVICFRRPCGYSPYGVPRYIGCFYHILGSRKSQEVNYLFFDNKSIPPMVVCVSGGHLRKESVKKLEDIFKYGIKGVENFHASLILEAKPFDVGDIPGEKMPSVKIDIKPLTQYIAKDGQFLEYQDVGRKTIASTFRLSGLYYGRSDEHTQATAAVSRLITEEQVFQPERQAFDKLMMRTIFADMQINHWNYKTIGAKTSDDAALLGAISLVKEALTLGDVRQIVGDAIGRPLAQLDEALSTLPLGLLSYQGMQYPNDFEETDEENKTQKSVAALMDLRKRVISSLESDGYRVKEVA